MGQWRRRIEGAGRPLYPPPASAGGERMCCYFFKRLQLFQIITVVPAQCAVCALVTEPGAANIHIVFLGITD